LFQNPDDENARQVDERHLLWGADLAERVTRDIGMIGDGAGQIARADAMAAESAFGAFGMIFADKLLHTLIR